MMPSVTQDNQNLYSNPSVLEQQAAAQMTTASEPTDIIFRSSEQTPGLAFHLPIEASSLSNDSTQFYVSQLASASIQVRNMCDDRDSVLLQSPYRQHHQFSTSADVQTSYNDGIPPIPAIQITDLAAHFACSENLMTSSMQSRATRAFVPNDRKDDIYWSKRHKNNDSARRSRVKRKAIEKCMQQKLLELQKENIQLKHEMSALRRRYAEDTMSRFDASPPKDTIYISASPSSLPGRTKPNNLQRSLAFDDQQLSDLPYVDDKNVIISSDNDFGTEITDHIENNSDSNTNIRCSTFARVVSAESQVSNCDFKMEIEDALDLTGKSSPSSSVVRSFSSDGESSTSSYKRFSFQTSESSSQEGNTSLAQAKFPLKCRWKKQMHPHTPSLSQ